MYICIHVLLIEAAGFGCLILERGSILTSSFLFSCKPAVMLQVAQARVLCISYTAFFVCDQYLTDQMKAYIIKISIILLDQRVNPGKSGL
jgi:hypothetical protein